MVLHGDADQAVNVEWSHYNVRMLERWGYDIRYVELPGYGHEDLNSFPSDHSTGFCNTAANATRGTCGSVRRNCSNASSYWVDGGGGGNDPADFMIVDAEHRRAQTIRLDTQNILALTLSPGPGLVAPGTASMCVWNGQRSRCARSERQDRAPRRAVFRPRARERPPRLPGGIGDIYRFPFTIVVGTSSADPAMNEICAQKAESLVKEWRELAKSHAADLQGRRSSGAESPAKYSLILIGGPEANLVARRMAGQLAVTLSGNQITVRRSQVRRDGWPRQAMRPNPLNPAQYLLLVAARLPRPGCCSGRQPTSVTRRMILRSRMATSRLSAKKRTARSVARERLVRP